MLDLRANGLWSNACSSLAARSFPEPTKAQTTEACRPRVGRKLIPNVSSALATRSLTALSQVALAGPESASKTREATTTEAKAAIMPRLANYFYPCLASEARMLLPEPVFHYLLIITVAIDTVTLQSWIGVRVLR